MASPGLSLQQLLDIAAYPMEDGFVVSDLIEPVKELYELSARVGPLDNLKLAFDLVD
jgi:hypothetical protein